MREGGREGGRERGREGRRDRERGEERVGGEVRTAKEHTRIHEIFTL